ncbi:MAG: hypothetical protein A2516_09610 [Alphaproteobacteria bacterium RIFOXYD12_FULL_60_8]|nr:MAG: hypothetical protein A2516_09610 [Alphaproteobacteria bacterium RIFOXYD12_FULL_60_8]
MRHGLIAALVVACFAAVGSAWATDFLQQTSALNGVTVKATPRAVSDQIWEIDLIFDTHSQEITDDARKAATLVADGGAALHPTEWRGDLPGGHHREGTLRFEGVAPASALLELRLQREGEPAPRVFRWSMGKP